MALAGRDPTPVDLYEGSNETGTLVIARAR
jgi:hypothetical protein